MEGYKKMARVGIKLLAFTVATACICLSVSLVIGVAAICKWAVSYIF